MATMLCDRRLVDRRYHAEAYRPTMFLVTLATYNTLYLVPAYVCPYNMYCLVMSESKAGGKLMIAFILPTLHLVAWSCDVIRFEPRTSSV